MGALWWHLWLGNEFLARPAVCCCGPGWRRCFTRKSSLEPDVESALGRGARQGPASLRGRRGSMRIRGSLNESDSIFGEPRLVQAVGQILPR